MVTIFSHLFASIITLPIIIYPLVFVVVKKMSKRHKKAVQVAVDVTTFVFILSVHFLTLTIWDQSYLWLIIIVMLLLAMITTVLHWKWKGEIQFKRIWKGFWRMNFLLFASVYFVLLFVGIFLGISHSLT